MNKEEIANLVFNMKYKTEFKYVNESVLFSQENKCYVRFCKNQEDIKITKMKLDMVIFSRNETALDYIEEGYDENADKYFLAYT